jgi:ABC-type transport system substrate-binding protein
LELGRLVARGAPLAAAMVAALLAVSGAGGAAQQTPKRGGTVVIAQSRHLEPPCLNPLLASCNSEFLDAVLLGAFHEAPGVIFQPELASAEIEDTNPFTLLYRIRPEARWSDGTPVTAGDFVFTQHAVLAHRADVNSEFLDHLDWIRSVSRVDAKTVRSPCSAGSPERSRRGHTTSSAASKSATSPATATGW